MTVTLPSTDATDAGRGYDLTYRINDNKKGFPQRDVHVDATPAEIARLIEDGYLVRRGLFDAGRIERLRSAVDHVVDVERDDPNLERIPRNGLYFRDLLNKDARFLDLLHDGRTRGIAQAVIGPQVTFDAEARVAPAGVAGNRVPWHIHLRVVPDPMPALFCYPHQIHCLLYLDDVGPEEGALVILPGSHRDDHLRIPDGDESEREGQIALEWKAGDVVIMHGNLWHRTIPSSANCRQRRLVLWGFAPAWLRSDLARGVKVPPVNTAPLRDGGDDEMVELLDGWHW